MADARRAAVSNSPNADARRARRSWARALVRSLIDGNRAASRWLDACLPKVFSRDGYEEFLHGILPSLLASGARVYDLGGGSLPCLTMEQKAASGVTLIGLDIDAEELAAAPDGLYDETICADVALYRGRGDGDLAVCLASLEHVRDVSGAMAALASMVKPGGTAAIFSPCRNAWFARLNLLLPQKLKERLLFGIFPDMADGHQGFEAFYDACTPREMEALARANGFSVEARHCWWKSDYFSFFVPLYALWRVWTLAARAFIGAQGAETFALILRRE